MNEAEVCQNLITPAIERAGWDRRTQIRREVPFTDGAINARGVLAARGQRMRADYLLTYGADIPLAIVEAKKSSLSISNGMQQALSYAQALDVPFAFSSNGEGFQLHDRTGQSDPIERRLSLDEFPSPQDLWARYQAWRALSPKAARLANQPYHVDASDKRPRYYQRIAVQRAVEAVARGQRRVLLVMATGTGKTYTVFQIIYRLWKAGAASRTLFLVDRNILADQTMTNDFKPFGAVMTKVRKRTMDSSYEVYLALYQGVSGSEDACC